MFFGRAKTLVAVLLAFLPALSWAVSYRASMNDAQWQLDLSVFECRMWQPIEHYGDAVFTYRAGEQQRFYLAPQRQEMRKGKALLVVNAPEWDEKRKATNLGYIPVSDGGQPIRLDQSLATRLLNELYEGNSPQFTRRSWYADEVPVNVALSSVNFRRAYREYRDCLAGLLPVNFDQIARSRVHFETAKWDLNETTKNRLDLIVTYVKADTSVNGFYIDGHTDDVGGRLYNLDLSKKRAEAVTAYLVAKGIDESLITTRYHGERYPVAKNINAANRQLNRRVTIRLERETI